MEKKKKSVLKIILNTLIIVLFIAALAVGGAIGFVYFKYNVNVFECIDQINQLKENVNISNLVTNGYTQADYDSIQGKIDDAQNNHVTEPRLQFTDRELCAYLSHNLNKLGDFKIAGTTLNNSSLELLQIKLSNIDVDQPSEHYCDMNVVIKLNIASLKVKKLNSFPLSLLSNLIPDDLYISATCSVDEVAGNYQVTPKKITINNLSADKTKNFFANINQFTNFITAKELNQNVSNLLVDALIGDDGIYGKLHELENGAKGYGWQKENIFVVYFVDVTAPHYITYHDSRNLGVENPNVTTYTIRNNIITLKPLACNGYKFLGWYMDVDGVSTKVETIDSATFKDYTLTCDWEVIIYTITGNLRGGKIGEETEYTKTYTVLEAVTLPTNATKKINESLTLEFAGWIGEDITEITKNVTIPEGSYGDRNYSAYYEGEKVTLNLVVDGLNVMKSEIDTGTVLSLDALNATIEDKFSGYTISDWYTNSACTNQYDYSAQLVENKTIYAKATYLTDQVYFYPYLEKFNYAKNHTSETLNIDSHKMLIGYIDYCVFYDVFESQNIRLHLNYSHSGSIGEEIADAVNERKTNTEFRKAYAGEINASFSYGYFKLSTTDTVAAGDLQTFGGDIYAQQDFALRADDLNLRDDDDYNDFKINNIGKQITVSNSEQLVWVLENGYRPNCVGDAAVVYNQAKQILRNICSDEMRDIEKLQAIYKWLALNVSYDQEAYRKLTDGLISDEEANTYDAWYVEGVFNHHKAVCEGYAKTLLIMAKMEGIPTICVSGNGHMWNRVYLGSAWYGIDATHGDLSISNRSHEIFTNAAFLFTDEYKSNLGYTATNYIDFAATTTINAYKYIKFNYHGNTYDLLIDNQAELSALINYIGDYSAAIDCEYYTIEVAVTNSNKDNFGTWFSTIPHYGWSLLSLGSGTRKDSYGNAVFMLSHAK